MTPEERYQLMMSRRALGDELDSGSLTDESGPAQPGVAKNLGMAPEQYRAGQPSGLDSVADTATAGGMMSGNPWVMGAGLGLKAVSAIDQGKRASEQAAIDAYNNKIMHQRQAVRNMFS